MMENFKVIVVYQTHDVALSEYWRQNLKILRSSTELMSNLSKDTQE